MPPTIDAAIEALRNLSPERQAELAPFLLHLAADNDVAQTIDPDDLPFVLRGLEQAQRGDYASPEEVENAYRSFDE